MQGATYYNLFQHAVTINTSVLPTQGFPSLYVNQWSMHMILFSQIMQYFNIHSSYLLDTNSQFGFRLNT